MENYINLLNLAMVRQLHMKMCILFFFVLRIVSAFGGTVPAYALHPSAKNEYREALQLLEKYANSDAFFIFVQKKRRYFSHTNLSVPSALRLFRHQLRQKVVISIEFGNNLSLKNALAVWNGSEIKFNIQARESQTERAGTLLHETAHRFGWEHKGNDRGKFDNINSFPYAIGDDFQEFLESEKTRALFDKKKKNQNARDILISRLSEFRYCYQKEIENSDGKIEGRAILKFTIGTSGKVKNGKILSTPLITYEMKSCMSQILISIRFPEHLRHESPTHSFEMKFSAKD